MMRSGDMKKQFVLNEDDIRQTIANSFKTYFSGKGDEGAATLEALPKALERAGIDPRRRGETLSQAEFIRLARAL